VRSVSSNTRVAAAHLLSASRNESPNPSVSSIAVEIQSVLDRSTCRVHIVTRTPQQGAVDGQGWAQRRGDVLCTHPRRQSMASRAVEAWKWACAGDDGQQARLVIRSDCCAVVRAAVFFNGREPMTPTMVSQAALR
jgi:hypothetical protein